MVSNLTVNVLSLSDDEVLNLCVRTPRVDPF